MTVRSMTGFGSASREADGLSVRVELRSVNHRGLALSWRTPAALDAHQPALETIARRHFARGTVTASVSLQRARSAAPSRVAHDVILDYADQTSAIAEELGLDPPTLGDLLRLPGALAEAQAPDLGPVELALVSEAFDEACAALGAMREREGAALDAELRALIAQVETHAAEVERRSPESVLAQRDRMRERLAQILEPGQDVPEEAIAREIAILADRTDVAEEVARLRSHVAQWREALDAGGPIGRRLDFLTQELGRETNTIGSKAQDAAITRIVVDMKVAVERLKEQAANLE